MSLTKETTFRELDRIQFGNDVPVIVIEQIPVGYGGQMSVRIHGLKVGLALGRKAVFPSDADPPYAQSLVRPFSWDTSLLTAVTPPPVELFANDARPLVKFEYFHCMELLRHQGRRILARAAPCCGIRADRR